MTILMEHMILDILKNIYFYGSSGLPVQAQKEYDDSNHKIVKGTIN